MRQASPGSGDRASARPRTRDTIILLHAAAPTKPAPASPCNGCGVCCAVAPCPLGMLLSRRRSGACAALQWGDGSARYGCGAVADPRRWLRALRWLPLPLLQRLVRRWIAAGSGCDSSLQAG